MFPCFLEHYATDFLRQNTGASKFNAEYGHVLCAVGFIVIIPAIILSPVLIGKFGKKLLYDASLKMMRQALVDSISEIMVLKPILFNGIRKFKDTFIALSLISTFQQRDAICL